MQLQWHTFHFAELDTDWLYAALRLRQEVFIVEQNCVYLDLDGRDQQAIHMFAANSGQVMAYQRCLPPGTGCPDSQLGRIVVHPKARGQDLGRKLVTRGIGHNSTLWQNSDIRISAQAHLQRFYTSLGFVAEGEEYPEDGIPHRQMRYSVSSAPYN
ncbi:MAG: GNAT family N-acetyltransferase [Halioglobus sp.]|nr:GNAT family N-acetyltransferase [Halioglobus sp.]